MRLLHTETYRLHDYFCSQVPRYAILSHTWGDREISYEEIQAATDPSAIPEFSKIQGACALVKSEGFEFIWIDTCCINKSSSSELSEAINSMYLWYQKAEVCYAYLATVESQPEVNYVHIIYIKGLLIIYIFTVFEYFSTSTDGL